MSLEVSCREERTAAVIAAYEVDGEVLRFEVEEHDGRASFELGLQGTGAGSGRHDDEAVDPTGDERLDELVFAFSEAVGAPGQDQVVVLSGDLLDAPQDRGEERVRHVDEDESDGAGARRRLAEVAGAVVRAVPERCDRLLDSGDQIFADTAFLVDDA